jgi:hypothetical protein
LSRWLRRWTYAEQHQEVANERRGRKGWELRVGGRKEWREERNKNEIKKDDEK